MKKKISISYDKEADVVYLSFGRPRKAVAEEIKKVYLQGMTPRQRN